MEDFKTLHLCIHGENTVQILQRLDKFLTETIDSFLHNQLIDNFIDIDKGFDYEFIKERYTSISDIFDRYLKEMEEITNES